MADEVLKLKNAPIIEAVLSIDCDMPPGREIASLEKTARDAFVAEYPKVQPVFMQEHRIDTNPQAPQVFLLKSGLQGFQFRTEDGKQIVQVKAQGFSFNRLAPYPTLDAYLPEMERTWNLFVQIAAPVQVRLVQLRYINRILLPMSEGKVDELEEYLRICPQLPDEDTLGFVGFFNQHAVVEKETDNQVNIVLATQPVENNNLPIIFDITAASILMADPQDWPKILERIQSLRSLKNKVFRNTLTEKCIKLFQE